MRQSLPALSPLRVPPEQSRWQLQILLIAEHHSLTMVHVLTYLPQESQFVPR